ncbi:SpaH/EbpB family LPXTG-anchored major pilin [Enterococcus asini]|uniref:SpaH/EbpB family LPXTG-anchored major pilin n=1 Tax=Enterococcus asini TaxID=57732 RepID=UPI00289172B2|nr:SpaH/EbpB family LPXTG-anchored major pilin [Enterococcus asini]MDT2743561.1 SpaH/EbpB family LPXTG-anchored major pilin [Enterococcus asini]
MIKKIVKVLLTVLLIVPSIAGLVGGGIAGYGEELPPEKASVTVHKKKMNSSVGPIQNTGDIMNEFDQYDGLENVEFKIYDVSQEFYASLRETNSRIAAIAAVQQIVPDDSDSRLVSTNSTDASGEFSVTLNKKSSVEGAEKDAVYLFVESPKAGVTIAKNMVLAFPVYQVDSDGKYTDIELSDIHLYPKNVVNTDGVIEVIKKGTADGAGLNGAQFVLQKMVNGEAWVVTGVNNGLYTWEKRFTNGSENPNAFKFESGKSYSIQESSPNAFEIVATDLDTAGKLIIRSLENGDYTLVEVEAPENAGMITLETETNFSIPRDDELPLDIMNDTIIVDKNEEKENHAIGDEIDYTISFRIPDGIKDVLKNGKKRYNKVELKDTHDSFLTLINEPANFILKSDSTPIPMKEDGVTYYEVKEDTSTNSFTVSLTPEGIAMLNPGKMLTFSYKMKLNSTATPDNGYKNKADVVVSGETDTLTGDDEEAVYTGGKRFVKIDADLAESNNKLEGAEFVVRDKNEDNANYLLIDPDTKEVSWVGTLDAATKFETKEDGIIDITGLAYGTYYLEETVAPEGYVKLEKWIKFVVEEASYKELNSLTEELKAPTEVVNRHKGTLPSTGGMGIVALLTFGVAAFGIAGWYFKRNGKAEV